MFHWVPTEKLAEICNPLTNNPWDDFGDLTQAVHHAIAENRLVSEPYSVWSQVVENQDNVYDHAGRIAYLVNNPCRDAIDIDVGVPSLGCHVDWIIQDGNHRLSAAIFRGDDEVPAEISGEVKFIKSLFGKLRKGKAS